MLLKTISERSVPAMFSEDRRVNFKIVAQRKADNYGVKVLLNWEKSIIGYQGVCTDEQWQQLLEEMADLIRLYDLEELF